MYNTAVKPVNYEYEQGAKDVTATELVNTEPAGYRART